MPADKVSVNLMEKESLEDSPIGRIVNWAITFGRYIMITTEIIVLLAFISRFSLDRKLTDLNEAISQKQAIIEANQDFEYEFRLTKQKIEQIKGMMDQQKIPLTQLMTVKNAMPADLYLEQLSISKEGLNGEAVAGTTNGFAVFLYKLRSQGVFEDVTLGEIKKQPLKGIVFTFTAVRHKPKPVVPKEMKQIENGSDKEKQGANYGV